MIIIVLTQFSGESSPRPPKGASVASASPRECCNWIPSYLRKMRQVFQSRIDDWDDWGLMIKYQYYDIHMSLIHPQLGLPLSGSVLVVHWILLQVVWPPGACSVLFADVCLSPTKSGIRVVSHPDQIHANTLGDGYFINQNLYDIRLPFLWMFRLHKIAEYPACPLKSAAPPTSAEKPRYSNPTWDYCGFKTCWNMPKPAISHNFTIKHIENPGFPQASNWSWHLCSAMDTSVPAAWDISRTSASQNTGPSQNSHGVLWNCPGQFWGRAWPLQDTVYKHPNHV